MLFGGTSIGQTVGVTATRFVERSGDTDGTVLIGMGSAVEELDAILGAAIVAVMLKFTRAKSLPFRRNNPR